MSSSTLPVFNFQNNSIRVSGTPDNPLFCLLYLTGTMFYLKKKYNYNNMCNWNKMLQDSLFLPVLENGDIDTAYMEAYIAALKKRSY